MKDKVLKILSKVINVILKVILIISSLPFIGVLLESINAMFFGMSKNFFGDQTLIYGFEAFSLCLIFRVLLLVQIGILPICLSYQLFYLIRHLIKKHKLKNLKKEDDLI